MKKEERNNSIKITFNGTYLILLNLLGVAFILLKVFKVIKWSWVFVLSPFILMIALIVITFVIAFTVGYILSVKK